MLDMLLIPIILPSIDVTEEPAIPSQVEVAYSYQDRNPYKCVELINTYIDGKIRTDVTSGSIADKSFRPSKQAVSEENAENSESQNSDDSVTPSENQEEESLKTEEEPRKNLRPTQPHMFRNLNLITLIPNTLLKPAQNRVPSHRQRIWIPMS